MNDKAAECATHMVLTLTMRNADPSDQSPYRTFCPLCIIGEVESLKTKLSELGLRTDNHNASRKSEIEYLRADVDRIDRINTGVLLGLADVLKMGPARELRLIGAKLVSRVADWLGGAK